MTLRFRFLAPVLMVLPALCAPAPGVKLPAYTKVTLGNGMTVLLMEQHKVPMVSLTYLVRGGASADPQGKEGLASLTAALLRKGTRTRNADQISEQLDSVGAQFGAGAGPDYSSGGAEFMAKDVSGGLKLVADLLMNPAFPEAEVKKLAAQRVDGIRSAKDSAQGVIRTYFNAFLYGSHPYGRPAGGDERSLASLTRDDVVDHYAATYLPGNLTLAIVGDFKTAEMKQLVTATFGAWRSARKPLRATMPAPRAPEGRRLLLVDKPDATQTYFVAGAVGVARDNPDRVGIEVVNVLFGERFTSMINTALRIKSGLTYGARAGFDQRKAAGPFAIQSFTANATTEKALDLMLATLRQLHEKGISEEDLASAKAYLKGTLPPKTLETSDQLADLLVEMDFHGLPDSDVNDYYAKVDAMTVAEARRIIRTYYPQENLTFVLVGKASEIAPLAKKYADQVVTRPISQPGF